jgi:hypothetical protein
MKATIKDDFIVRVGAGDTEIGQLPKGVGLERLRWTPDGIIDLMDLEEIWVKHLGNQHFELHAVKVPGSHRVKMSYRDRKNLICEYGYTRVMRPEETVWMKTVDEIKTDRLRKSKRINSLMSLDQRVENLYFMVYAIFKKLHPELEESLPQVSLNRTEESLESFIEMLTKYLED